MKQKGQADHLIKVISGIKSIANKGHPPYCTYRVVHSL